MSMETYTLEVRPGSWYVRIGPGTTYSSTSIVTGGTVLTGTKYNKNWYYLPDYDAYIGVGAVLLKETVAEQKHRSIVVVASRGDIAKILTAVYSGDSEPPARMVINDPSDTVYSNILFTCKSLQITPIVEGGET